MSSATRGGGGGGGSEFSLVLSFLATPGSRVRKGDVIAEFDRQYQLLRIDDYKASVLQADLNIRKIKADLAVTTESRTQQLRVAKATLDKARLDLKTLEVVSDIDAQRLKLAAEEAEARYKQLLSEDKLFRESQRAQLRIAEIELAQNQIEMRRAQANVDKMLLKAPMDGIVVLQSIRRGMEMAQVQQGDQVWPGMVFMQIVDPSSMVLNANINQVDSESLRIGMKADVRFDAYPGLAMPAHVYSIGAVPVAGRRANFMKEIKVRLKLEGQDARVIPDLSASADVTLGHVEQAALAPLGAIQWAQGGKPFVLVRSPGGWDRREVEIALRNHLAAAIRSGLRPGEVVALSAAAADKTSEENPPAS